MAGNIKGFHYILGLVALCFLGMSGVALAEEQSKDEATPSDSSFSQYQLGQGLRLGDTGFVLGGYASAQYQDTQNADPRFSLSHLSAFLWWEGASRVKFFAEVDSEDSLASRYQEDAGERRQITLERLYVDYAFNDALTVRAGKFLTPIGRWNLVHAEPLVWTTSRPLISMNVFPDNATGLMAMGNLPVQWVPVDYTIYTSLGRDPHRNPEQDPFDEAYGARLNFGVGESAQIGLSYASFTQRTWVEERKRLLGGDFLWARNGYEVTGEVVFRYSNQGPNRDVHGGFVQAVAPFPGVDRLFIVGRREFLREPDAPSASMMTVLGVNFRYTPATVFKLEHIHTSDAQYSMVNGVLASFSVLF